jgi:hypothetical protein
MVARGFYGELDNYEKNKNLYLNSNRMTSNIKNLIFFKIIGNVM